nr:immunoglobulin heavy chain junction region [Mus musculus]
CARWISSDYYAMDYW